MMIVSFFVIRSFEMDYPILSIAGSPSEIDTSKKVRSAIWLVNFIVHLNLLVFSTCFFSIKESKVTPKL